MSFQGAVRRHLTIGGMAALGVMALSPILLNSQVYAQDSDSSRPAQPETVQRDVPSEPIPNPTLRESSSELRSGNKTVRNGINSNQTTVNRPDSKEKQPAAKKVVDRSTKRSTKPERLKFAKRGNYPSRGYFSGRRIIEMHATAYTAAPSENGGNRSGRTAIGLKIGHGVVAVDPRVIPLGTRLFIEGYGHAVAADTGSAIKGQRIDLGVDTRRESNRIGRRKVKVHILD